MKKVILLIIIFLLLGCSNNKKFYLTEKYYHNGEFIAVKTSELEENESFILYTYNNFCALPIHCENIFKEVMEKLKIDVLSMPFDEFKNTKYYQKVKYAPSILIIKNGELIDYLKADSDDDYDKYQKTDVFEKWLNEYIIINQEAKN